MERYFVSYVGTECKSVRWRRKQVGDGPNPPRVCRAARVCARRERGTVPSGFFVSREICRFRLRTRRLRA